MLNPILPVYKRCNLEFVSGEGCFLTDNLGKKYLDLGAGIAVNSLGYGNKKLVNALKKAADNPWHISNYYNIPGQKELATKLANNSSCDQVFFCNSGTEAIEASIKIVRQYFYQNKKPQKKNILTFEHAFHGRTIAAISAGGNKQYQQGYTPLLPGFINIPLQDANSKNIETYIDDTISAIIIEPIQGEGGVNVFTHDFLQSLDKICKAKEIILIADEVQCGIGRTGKMFHYEWSNISPDIITAAKGIGGGFPLAACLVKEHIGKVMPFGSHGGTYGGNPLAMSIGNAVIDEILSTEFLDNVIKMGEVFKDSLRNLQKTYPSIISEIRGEGLMLGIQTPNQHFKIAEMLREEGVLTIPASNDVIRIIPPLIISESEINLAFTTLEKVIKRIHNE